MNVADFEVNSSYYISNSKHCSYEYWESIPRDDNLQSPTEVQGSLSSYSQSEDGCWWDEEASSSPSTLYKKNRRDPKYESTIDNCPQEAFTRQSRDAGFSPESY